MSLQLQIGVAGKKYGLIKNPSAEVFGEDDDSQSVEKKAQEAVKRRRLRQEEENAKVLAEDPTAFEYDEVFDQMKATIEVKSQQPVVRKSRYMNSIMAKAGERKNQRDLVYERKLLKDQKEEKEEFGDAPKFVTSSYKAHLQKIHAWEAEDRKKDLREDVTKQKDLRAFYSNLLTKNVAYGGADPVPDVEPEPTLKRKISPESDRKRDRSRGDPPRRSPPNRRSPPRRSTK